MSTDRRMRASDQDRDRVTEVLREAYAVGRLSREEYDERSVATYAARTWADLDDITADLPGPPPEAAAAARVAARARSRAAARERPRARVLWMFVVVLAAGLIGRVFPAVAWVAAVVFSLVLVLPFLARGAGVPSRRSRHDELR